jgi:hypothetical protein
MTSSTPVRAKIAVIHAESGLEQLGCTQIGDTALR